MQFVACYRVSIFKHRINLNSRRLSTHRDWTLYSWSDVVAAIDAEFHFLCASKIQQRSSSFAMTSPLVSFKMCSIGVWTFRGK